MLLYETLFVPVLLYGSEIVVWREKERSRGRAVQMDNRRGLLGIRRIDRVPNAGVRKLCRVTKWGGIKRLMKAFSNGSAILKEWVIIGLLKGYTWGRVLNRIR